MCWKYLHNCGKCIGNIYEIVKNCDSNPNAQQMHFFANQIKSSANNLKIQRKLSNIKLYKLWENVDKNETYYMQTHTYTICWVRFGFMFEHNKTWLSKFLKIPLAHKKCKPKWLPLNNKFNKKNYKKTIVAGVLLLDTLRIVLIWLPLHIVTVVNPLR